MKTILIICYSLNPEHPVFAHQSDIVKRISRFYDRTVVIPILDELPYIHDSRILVLPFGWQHRKKVRNSFRFICLFLRSVINFKPQVIFSHMTNGPSSIVAPITFLMRIPHHLWYAHASLPFSLRVSKTLFTTILSSTRGSCPIKGENVRLIGQGVNHLVFPAREFRNVNKPLRVITVSRVDPPKNIGFLMNFFVNEIRLKVPKSNFRIVGEPTTRYLDYADGLKSSLIASKLQDCIEFLGSRNKHEISSLLTNSDLFIHAFKGSLDKSLIEATMVGVPVVTLNMEYINEFGSWSSKVPTIDDFEFLRIEVESLLRFPSSILKRELNRRSKKAVLQHSLDQWVSKLDLTLKLNSYPKAD